MRDTETGLGLVVVAGIMIMIGGILNMIWG